MAGISSKAAGKLENRKKYQGYEYNNDFDVDFDESFYRTYDPQIGRFLQVDPSPKFEESPYVSMGNNPVSNVDPMQLRIIIVPLILAPEAIYMYIAVTKVTLTCSLIICR